MSAPAPVPPALFSPVVAAGLPLQAAQAAFAWLCRGPSPVGIDGRRIPGLPARPVPVDELRDRLADPRCPAATSDAVWARILLSAPAINPVVLVATAVAFPQNPEMVLARFVASLLVAVVMGLVWEWCGRPGWLRPPPQAHLHGGSRAAAFRLVARHDFLQAGVSW